MTWNYRVIEFVTPDGDPWQGIFEVYYDKDGKPDSYTENPVPVTAEGEGEAGLSELGEVMDMMRTACRKPVLYERDFQVTQLANALEEAGLVPSSSGGE